MAVEVRYPGMTADEDAAAESLKAATLLRETVQEILCSVGDAGVK